MFCSIIIPTVGRPSLSKSVESVLKQNFEQADFEIIVVNDAGQPLPSQEWQTSDKVHIISTQKRERCFARNTGAAIATGDYLCFLDDDDWLLPNALKEFWQTAKDHPHAGWLYGGTQFIDENDKILGFLNQKKSGNCFLETMTETWIPLQASLIKAEAFFHIGGFDPDFIVTQDLDLVRRIAMKYELISIPHTLACIRRGNSRKTETKYTIGWYYIAWGRDRLLANPEAFSRLINSAGNSSFLHGLVLRNYISALLFNLRKHHWANALSRFFATARAFLKTIKHAFSKEYWAAVNLSQPLHISLIKQPSPDYDTIEEWLFK